MAGYCDADDVRSILSNHGLTAYVDDDESGGNNAAETQLIADAIDRSAALQIDIYLDERYPTRTAWASNPWAKWANAVFATVEVMRRRGMVPPESIVAQAQDIRDQIERIRKGQLRVPGVADPMHPGPMVSNYDVERGRARPVRVTSATSTGPNPDPKIKRNPSSGHTGYFY